MATYPSETLKQLLVARFMRSTIFCFEVLGGISAAC